MGLGLPFIAGAIIGVVLGQTGGSWVVLAVIARHFVDHHVERRYDVDAKSTTARFEIGIARRPGPSRVMLFTLTGGFALLAAVGTAREGLSRSLAPASDEGAADLFLVDGARSRVRAFPRPQEQPSGTARQRRRG